MASNQFGDWRCNCPNLTDIMSKAKDKSLFTDITFVVGQDPFRKTLHAHKIILAGGSLVFEKMFFGDMAEKKNPIVIEEDDPEAFDMLIIYIYGKGDKIKLKSFSSAWNYYSIGDKYLVEGIREDAEQFIMRSRMTEENFWILIENELYAIPIFKKKLNSYFNENPGNVFQTLMSEKFIRLPECFVMGILKMEKIDVQEYELLERVARWGIANSADESKMKQLLQHIRFSTLKLGDFCEFTDRFPDAIDLCSCVAIMKHLHKKSLYKLPEWCSTDSNS